MEKEIKQNSAEMIESIYGYVEKSLLEILKGENSNPLKTIEYGGSLFIILKNGNRYRLNLSKYSQEVVLDKNL